VPGTWRHLTARFFRVTVARPLDASEHRQVHAVLRPEEYVVFDTQPVIDQRHGFEAMDSVRSVRGDRVDLQRAALLHDVGKRHARLGVFGRVVASLLAKLHLPVRGRLRLYLEHGRLAADELDRLGAEPIVIDFARDHHGERPSTITVEDWTLLQQADR
jgi:putative nucleotidyltransferase with HDIG domain